MPYVSQSDKDMLDKAKAQQSGGGGNGFSQWVPLIIAMLMLPSLKDEDTSLANAETAMTALQPSTTGTVNANVDAIKASYQDTCKKRKAVNRAEKLAILIEAIFVAFSGGGLGGMGGGGSGVILVVLIVLLLSNSSGGSLFGGIF